jgi:outer membrane beta-barrel protein
MRTTTTLALTLALSAAPAVAQDEEAAEAAAPEAAPAASADSSGDSDIAEEGGEGEDTETTGTGKTLAERISAVSHPVFLKQGRFELAPFAGISANDAFFRRWSVGARASFHILDSLSIDVGGAYNFWSEPLQAAVFLGVDDPDVELDDEAALYGYADAGVTFAPFYGKVALMSEWIIHFDGFVSGGAGGVFDSSGTIFQPALEIGAGGRMFLTRWMVIRADVRDYIYPRDLGGQLGIQNLVILNLGVGFYFPFDFEYEREVQKS